MNRDKLLALAGNRRAPDGMAWQCCACGKRAEERYGLIGWRSPGWDASCMLNAVPVPDHRALADAGQWVGDD